MENNTEDVHWAGPYSFRKHENSAIYRSEIVELNRTPQYKPECQLPLILCLHEEILARIFRTLQELVTRTEAGYILTVYKRPNEKVPLPLETTCHAFRRTLIEWGFLRISLPKKVYHGLERELKNAARPWRPSSLSIDVSGNNHCKKSFQLMRYLSNVDELYLRSPHNRLPRFEERDPLLPTSTW